MYLLKWLVAGEIGWLFEIQTLEPRPTSSPTPFLTLASFVTGNHELFREPACNLLSLFSPRVLFFRSCPSDR